MSIPIIDSRNIPNSWRTVDDKTKNFRSRGLPFRFQYVGSYSQALAEWFVRVYSNPGDIILDPFSGRSTTAMQSLFHDRNVVCNDLSPYSNVLCHSVLWPIHNIDVIEYIRILEEYVKGDKCKIPVEYAGKGSEDDVARLYSPYTFDQIIKSRNLLNNRSVLLGRGYDSFSTTVNGTWERDHEIVMFIRMIMTQLSLGNSAELTFNGIKMRGTDNTNVKAILRYYETLGESPQDVDIFERMIKYVQKMDLDSLGVVNRFRKLNRRLIACDARKLDISDKSIDGVITSPPYTSVLNYGMANWLRIWCLNGIGDPLVIPSIKGDIEKLEMSNTSEVYGKSYDKITDSTNSTVTNVMSYSKFTGEYLRELYRVLKDDAFCIIIVGDYGGSKKKLDAYRLVIDRSIIFGFRPMGVIMDKLNTSTKSSSQFQDKHGGGRNDYDVCVVLKKGNYKRKNNPEDINFQWSSKYADSRQKSIDEMWR